MKRRILSHLFVDIKDQIRWCIRRSGRRKDLGGLYGSALNQLEADLEELKQDTDKGDTEAVRRFFVKWQV